MTVDDLEALIEALDWDDFRCITDGNIHVHVPYVKRSPGLIRFAYRVGLHMKQPMEAIMAQDNYIRMQAAPQYAACRLERLDPENADQCLYTSHFINTNTYSIGWQPQQLPLQPPLQPYINVTPQNITSTLSGLSPHSNVYGSGGLGGLGHVIGNLCNR